jgi:SNF2 family DNA or RNA helicase
MVTMLKIIAEFLNHRKWNHEVLTGSTSRDERQKSIDRFCTNSCEDSFVFLLSTKAGGQGLNLTRADTVIIFDSDWNPMNDLQAQARYEGG